MCKTKWGGRVFEPDLERGETLGLDERRSSQILTTWEIGSDRPSMSYSVGKLWNMITKKNSVRCLKDIPEEELPDFSNKLFDYLGYGEGKESFYNKLVSLRDNSSYKS